VYEKKNLAGQDITSRDVAKPKALVQARRLRRINPRVTVEAFVASVEDVPLGRLRADLILACLDSRGARRYVNEAAWRLNVPWIDSGVHADGLLARANVYVPGPDTACMECGWDDRDYEQQKQEYACLAGGAEPTPTNAPSALGALAASIQAVEAQKLLTGDTERAAIGKQILIDALHHRFYLTELRRNARCRFDHETWDLVEVGGDPGNLTIGEALGLHAKRPDGNGEVSLRAERQPFVGGLRCPSCGRTKSLLRLQHRLTPNQQKCPKCGPRMAASGADMVEDLTASNVSARRLRCSLRSLGFRPGDVFAVGDSDGQQHYVFGEVQER